VAAGEGGAGVEPFLRDERFERVYLWLQHEPKMHTKDRERVRLLLEAV